MGQCVGRPHAIKLKRSPSNSIQKINARIEEKAKKIETLEQDMKEYDEELGKTRDSHTRNTLTRRKSRASLRRDKCESERKDLVRQSSNFKKAHRIAMGKNVEIKLEDMADITQELRNLAAAEMSSWTQQENTELVIELEERIRCSN